MSESKLYYSITATPSKSNHVTHTVATFDSYDECKKHLRNESYDPDDACTWTYSIAVREKKDLSDNELEELGKIPSYYPYTGW